MFCENKNFKSNTRTEDDKFTIKRRVFGMKKFRNIISCNRKDIKTIFKNMIERRKILKRIYFLYKEYIQKYLQINNPKREMLELITILEK